MVRKDIIASEKEMMNVVSCIQHLLPKAFLERENMANVRDLVRETCYQCKSPDYVFATPPIAKVLGQQVVVGSWDPVRQ